MLKQAVDSHKPNPKPSTKSLQQLLSSSPSVPTEKPNAFKAFKPPTIRPLSDASANVQKPRLLGSQHSTSGQIARPITSSAGLKRTASGVLKSLEHHDSFEYNQLPTTSFNNTRRDPISITSPSPKKKVNTAQAEKPVFFDENDFDSDIELEMEELATKGSIDYPSLPVDDVPLFDDPVKEDADPFEDHSAHQWDERWDSTYHSAPQKAQKPAPLPPSSKPYDWSSSPADHMKTPPKAASRQARSTLPAVKEEPADSKPRLSKRRKLPWLQEKTEEPPQEQRSPKRRASASFTPLPKNTKDTLYPWNTTASAIKEQQKNLRQANKRAIKTNEASADDLTAAVTRKKSNRVAKVFLSEEQQHVLDLVVEHKNSVFFTGSAGTGKSVCLREIISALRKKYSKEPDRVAVTASTGLAACNIGGTTLHSFAGIGIGKEDAETLVKKIKRNQKARHRWMRTKVLVVDEVSMVDGALFDKLEQIARTLRNNGRPFGGIQLVITGDFFQLPPVPDYNQIAKFAFDAGTWTTCIEHTIGLTHVFRQKDPVFANMLNQMREGRLTSASIDSFKKLNRDLKFDDELEATELYPKRQQVDLANNKRLAQLAGDLSIYEAKDSGAITDPVQRDRLLQNCMAPPLISLKKGAQVMLIKNIDESLVNGSLGKVISFMSERQFELYQDNEEDFYAISAAGDGENELDAPRKKFKARLDALVAGTEQTYPVIRFSVPDGTTRDLLCQREKWSVELPNGEVQASRSQVPLILAWALSIHKAQGQTLERVRVDLGSVFERGQAYVALSRATSMAGLQVLNFDARKVMAHEKVRAFYAKLKQAQSVGPAAAGKGPKKGTKSGLTVEEYERQYVENPYDDDEAALAAAGG